MTGLSRYFHSRSCTTLMFVIAVVMTCVAYSYGHVTEITGNRGMVFPSPNEWLPPCDLSLVISLVIMGVTAFGFIGLNKVYNFMRAPSALAATFYIVMLSSLPLAAGQFYGGSLMSLLLLGIIAIIFSCYDDRTATRKVFLIFFLLSFASMVQYAFMFYIPIMVAGLAQMRILNMRSIIAMLIGVICPVWILYAFGLMDFGDISWPRFTSTLSRLSVPGMITLFTAVGLTMILGFAAMCGCIMKMLGYNAKYRAYNGFLTLLMLSTMIFIIVDYANLSVYFPTLCLTSASQMAHYFSIRQNRASQWIILSIICIYLIIYSTCYYLN